MGAQRGATDEVLRSDEPEFYFWLRHARRSQEPVVVLAASAARVAIPLAQQGIAVVAVEPEGVGEGRDAVEGLRWQHGEATRFTLARKAGMILLPDQHFETLLSLDEQKQALRTLHMGLQIGGKLALTLSVPDIAAMAQQGEQGSALRPLPPLTDAARGETVLRWQTERCDVAAQQIETHTVYEQLAPDGSTARRWHRTQTRAYHWPREMRLLLELSGFDIEALYGGWNDEPFTAHAAQQVWVARKGV